MLKKSASSSSSLLELWNEELEGKSDFSNYRTRLVCLVFSRHLHGPWPLCSIILGTCVCPCLLGEVDFSRKRKKHCVSMH
jgi:hypothetical protein